MTKEEQLTLLLKYIAKLAEEEPWFKQELYKFALEAQKDKVEDLITDNRHYQQIHEIYDYFFRKITEKHANNFYKSLDIDSKVKLLLVSDFIKMEFYRRDDKFENFCLSGYQQLEGIVNYFFDKNNLKVKAESAKNDVIITAEKSGKTETVLSIISPFNKSSNFEDWSFKKKLNAVLFFECYKGKMDYFQKNEYDRLSKIGVKISQGRNMVHRGIPQFPSQQIVIDDLLNSTERHYLMFLGFLEEFVSKLPRTNSKNVYLDKNGSVNTVSS